MVSRRCWIALAGDLDIPTPVVERLTRAVATGVGSWLDEGGESAIPMPDAWRRDLRRRILRRIRDIDG